MNRASLYLTGCLALLGIALGVNTLGGARGGATPIFAWIGIGLSVLALLVLTRALVVGPRGR